jgi:GNAT superfamily N-acetyltransferase
VYGDVYMKIAEPFRQLGLGTYLVQELKALCRADGSIPSARCNVDNLPSRRTLQKAGFVPCGALIAGDLRGWDRRVSARKRRTRAEVQQLVVEFVSSGMRRSEVCRKLQHKAAPFEQVSWSDAYRC